MIVDGKKLLAALSLLFRSQPEAMGGRHFAELVENFPLGEFAVGVPEDVQEVVEKLGQMVLALPIDSALKAFYYQCAQLLLHQSSKIAALEKELTMLYSKWEDGNPCYTGYPDTEDGFLGNAFRLTNEEENRVLALIPKQSDAASAEGGSGD